ncbi:hypothetical protein ABPG72_005393 [Tetrahymena utriculariae]
MMEVENQNIIENNQDVEVKIKKTYVSANPNSQRVVVRYIISFKDQHFQNKIMIVNFDIKQQVIQTKLVNSQEPDPKFNRVEFLDLVNLRDKFQKQIYDKKLSILDQKMYHISENQIQKIFNDGIQRFFDLSLVSAIDKKYLSGSKPKNSYGKLFTSLFENHKYYSKSKDKCREGYQFLYIMQTSLCLPQCQNCTTIKIGKTAQSIESYVHDLVRYYNQRILFHPLVYFEIPCDKGEGTIVDKCIHSILNESKSENRIYIQGLKHLHQEFFLLDKNLVDALCLILFSPIYCNPYKKEYSQKDNTQRIIFNISQISNHYDQNPCDNTEINELVQYIQNPQKNGEQIYDSFLESSLIQSQLLSTIDKTCQEVDISQCQKNLNNSTPKTSNISYNSQDELNQQNTLNLPNYSNRIPEQNNEGFYNNKLENGKIYDKSNLKVQLQPINQKEEQRNKTEELSQVELDSTRSKSSNNQQIYQNPPSNQNYIQDHDLQKCQVKEQRNKTEEISEVELESIRSKSSNNQQIYQNPPSNQNYIQDHDLQKCQVKEQRNKTEEISEVELESIRSKSSNNQQIYQNPPSNRNYIQDHDLQKYKFKEQYIIDKIQYVYPSIINVQEGHPCQTMPSAPLPPNSTHLQSFDKNDEIEHLQELLHKLDLEEQKLQDLSKEIKEKYDEIAKM